MGQGRKVAVTEELRFISLALACRVFGAGATCSGSSPKLRVDDEVIADLSTDAPRKNGEITLANRAFHPVSPPVAYVLRFNRPLK